MIEFAMGAAACAVLYAFKPSIATASNRLVLATWSAISRRLNQPKDPQP